jgi:hypothetical protein
MLRYGGEFLIEKEFQAVMIRLDKKQASPQVSSLVTNCMHQPYHFPLISSKFGVSWRDWFAEECHWSSALMEDRAEPRPGRITFNNEWGIEIRQL